MLINCDVSLQLNMRLIGCVHYGLTGGFSKCSYCRSSKLICKKFPIKVIKALICWNPLHT